MDIRNIAVLCAVTAVLVFGNSAVCKAETVAFDAMIEPCMTVELGNSVPGVLEEVYVDRGDRVKKGQVLARMRSGVEEAAMKLAKARTDLKSGIEAKRLELQFAERKKERFSNLFKRNSLPNNEWDEIQTSCELAAVQLDEALEQQRLRELEFRHANEILKRMDVSSPLSGVVVERYRNPGEYIENTPLMKLAKIDLLYVELIAPVEMYGRIQTGMVASIEPEPPIKGNYSAKVIVVDPVMDAASGTFGVRLALPNGSYQLPSGLKCKVIFQDI